MRPVICRQERVGVHMADGFARVTNGKPVGVFAMQYGPGAENAFAGVASAYSEFDADPAAAARPFAGDGAGVSAVQFGAQLCLGHQVGRERHAAGADADVMRRAFNALRNGRPAR